VVPDDSYVVVEYSRRDRAVTIGREPDLSFGLGGKVALVTGAASGIGAAIATMYVAKGASVAIVDVNLEAGNTLAAQLGCGSSALFCDVSNAASVTAVAEQVIDTYGRVDILVNCAGVVRLAPAEDLTLDAWETTLDINLKGTFLMCQTIGRHMLAAGRGKVINMASQAGTVALDRHAAYCASKFGVIGFTRVLASEWAGRGVTANTISPTVVLTDLGRQAWSGDVGEAMKRLIPTGRFALPEEIAAAAVYLGSDLSDMVNGADLVIDGGYTIR
jgi:NAD(P)-dependent dehydrogenase (short-subunit alcohol dehydrogenase family)